MPWHAMAATSELTHQERAAAKKDGEDCLRDIGYMKQQEIETKLHDVYINIQH